MGLVCRSSVLASSALFFYGFAIIMVFKFLGGGGLLVEWSLSSLSLLELSVPVVFDWMTVSFSLTVTTISLFVILFSTSYMDSEENLARFIWLVMLFVLSMNLLIFIPSFMAIILGWDGLGLVSFVLVIYYQNHKSLGAGLVTAFMNRVGDAFLLLGISLLSVSGHWLFWGHTLGGLMLGVVMVIIVLVSMTKSAQIPFSYWLPAAMNAPTPVSALVHSSTLVTAGVYLLIRVYSGMAEVPEVGSMVLMGVALFTMNMAGFSACFEVDLKKVIALSTLSQLGVMMFSLSLGYYVLAFFHLMSHAFFKALMFVSVGRVIHGFKDSQELRNISGLWLSMPLTSGMLVLASMSLMGLPFLSGFYSKDLIVESCLSGALNWFVLGLVMAAMLGTAMYSLRVFMCSIWGKGNSLFMSSESQSMYEVIPSLGLGVGAIGGGYYMQSVLFDFGEIFVLEGGYKLFLLGVVMSGILLMYLYSFTGFRRYKGVGVMGKAMKSFFVSMWFLSYVARVSSLGGLKMGQVGYKEVDLGWNEAVLGGVGMFELLLGVSAGLLMWFRSHYFVWLYASFIGVVLLVQFSYP